ncbi:MAG: hypothetical protein ACRERV_00095, partial [Methylococcales bacterium]
MKIIQITLSFALKFLHIVIFLQTTLSAMTTNTSSIAAASSNIQERVEEAIQKASANLGKERIQRIKQVKLRADDLSNRGFLRRQTYSSLSSADGGRLY